MSFCHSIFNAVFEIAVPGLNTQWRDCNLESHRDASESGSRVAAHEDSGTFAGGVCLYGPMKVVSGTAVGIWMPEDLRKVRTAIHRCQIFL